MEIWKDIKEYEGLYQVSNLGRVRSLDRTYIAYNRFCDIETYIKGKILKNVYNKKGYQYVGLHKDGKRKNIFVHRLVAETFLPNPDNKPCVNHINTVRDDNRVENIEWCTHKENNNNPLTIKKMRESAPKTFMGKFSKEHPRSIPIIQLNIHNTPIKLWLSLSDAKRNNYRDSEISSCCRGRKKTHKGYKWMYLDDYLADWWEQEMEKGVA